MDYTENLNLKKPSADDFYDIADFNDNADILDARVATKEELNAAKTDAIATAAEDAAAKAEAAKAMAISEAVSSVQQSDYIGEIQTALDEKAEDDFMHMPLAVCNTAGEQQIKEITIPNYSEEKYPIFAVKFANANSCDEDIKLSINGQVSKSVRIGQKQAERLSLKSYPIPAGAILKFYAWDSYFVVDGSYNSAATDRYGMTVLANSLDRLFAESNACATTPEYVSSFTHDHLQPYDETRTYDRNDMALADGKIYRSRKDRSTGNSVTDTEWWIQYGEDISNEYPQLVHYTMLYDQGDECSEVTGGWEKKRDRISSSAAILIKNANNLHMSGVPASNNNNPSAFGTTNKVDLTNYSSIGFCYKRSTISNAESHISVGVVESILANGSGMGEVLNSGPGVFLDKSSTAKIIEILDVASINGMRYCCAEVWSYRNPYGYSTIALYNSFLLMPDDHNTWQSLAGYSEIPLGTLVADSGAMTALMSSERAIEFMIKQCTGTVMAAVLQSEIAKAALKASPYLNRIIANPHWAKFLMIFAPELLNYTMLYDEGDECESVTGGWMIGYNTNSSSLSMSKQTDYLSFNATNNASGIIRTTNQINLSGYTTVGAVCSGTGYIDSTRHRSIDLSDSLLGPRTVTAKDGLNSETRRLIMAAISESQQMYVSAALMCNGNGAMNAQFSKVFILKSDSWQTWAAQVNITATDLDTLLSDSAMMQTLMSSTKAVDYLMGCTGTLMAAIVNSETAMTALDSSIYALSKTMRHPIWYKFMMMSPTAQTVLDSTAVKVPTMTSNTAPAGYATSSTLATAPANAYKVFDGNLSVADNIYPATGAANIDVSITLPMSMHPYRCDIYCGDSYGTGTLTATVIGTGDAGDDVIGLQSGLLHTSNAAINKNEIILPFNKAYRQYRFNVNATSPRPNITELQIYGKELMDL